MRGLVSAMAVGLLAAVAGCSIDSTVRKKAAPNLGCPENQVTIRDLGEMAGTSASHCYEVTGCGKRQRYWATPTGLGDAEVHVGECSGIEENRL
jgi:hypothetical protein